MTLEDRVHAQRLGVFRRILELDNVSAVCREAAISRTLVYRRRRDHEAYEPVALHTRRREAWQGRPSEVPAQMERAVVALAMV